MGVLCTTHGLFAGNIDLTQESMLNMDIICMKENTQNAALPRIAMSAIFSSYSIKLSLLLSLSYIKLKLLVHSWKSSNCNDG